MRVAMRKEPELAQASDECRDTKRNVSVAWCREYMAGLRERVSAQQSVLLLYVVPAIAQAWVFTLKVLPNCYALTALGTLLGSGRFC